MYNFKCINKQSHLGYNLIWIVNNFWAHISSRMFLYNITYFYVLFYNTAFLTYTLFYYFLEVIVLLRGGTIFISILTSIHLANNQTFL